MGPTVVLLRVWLDDQPGVLGAVASQVGAVGGDVIGIDILERGAGRAIDELWVELRSADQMEELVAQVESLVGVDVEDCRVVTAPRRSQALYSFEQSLQILELVQPAEVVQRAANLAVDVCSAEGAVVVPTNESDRVSALFGENSDNIVYAGPQGESRGWLGAFARGLVARAAVGPLDISEFPDLAVGQFRRSSLLLVVSRRGLVLREKERNIVSAIALAADHRLAEILD